MSATYLHGTCFSLDSGDVLVPGVTIGKAYGRSRHVYFVTDEFDANDIEDEHQRKEALEDPFTYAYQSARKWAEAAYDMARHEGHDATDLGIFVYEVEPQGEIEFDGDDEAGPESYRASSAVVLDRF